MCPDSNHAGGAILELQFEARGHSIEAGRRFSANRTSSRRSLDTIGQFVGIIGDRDCGQFSPLTANPVD
jgi:hypothetical protein